MKELTSDQEKLLNEIYYKLKLFRGRDTIWRYLRKNHFSLKISRRQVNDWLKKQTIHQLNVQPPKQVSSKPIYTSKPGYIQIDLLQIENSLILVVIDIFSRYMDAVYIKNKNENTVYRNFQKIKLKFPTKITTVASDNGTEFNLIEKKKELLGIKYIRGRAYVSTNQSIVERVNKNLRQMINKNGSFRKDLPMLVNNYNNSYHSSIKMTPNEAILNQEQVKNTLTIARNKKTKVSYKDIPLEISDIVRVVVKKTKLDKKSVNTYSKEKYKIVKIIKSNKPYNLIQYKLRNIETGNKIQGTFNISNLLKIPN